MFAFVEGVLDLLDTDTCVVDIGGLGINVNIIASLYNTFCRISCCYCAELISLRILYNGCLVCAYLLLYWALDPFICGWV